MSAIPVPYVSGQTVLGHYKVSQRSGSMDGGTPLVAASVISSFRWAFSNYAVVSRVRCGFIVNSTITTAVAMDFSLTVARGWSVDYSSNNTAANMASKAKTGAMRGGLMSTSLMGTTGPQICTTLGMTGATSTIDNNFAAVVTFPSLATTAGIGGQMFDLYQWTSLGDHPFVLSNGEGLIVRNISTGPATGTWLFYTQWEWAEVTSF